MAKTADGQHAPNNAVHLTYQLLRNTTSPDETASGVKSFVANVSAFEILKLDTKENLRSYIAEYNPKKRNRVHDAIKNTIETEPERFITRNSGFVVGCSDLAIDDAKKTLSLRNASILNGAQSRGEIGAWRDRTYPDGVVQGDEVPFHVRVEIVVDPDSDEVVETAIARNTATPVKSISQAGARGHLEELEASIRRRRPEIRIRKSETDEDVYDTRKILQYTRLLMPSSVSSNNSASEKLRAYKNPEQCLTDFSEWFETKEGDEGAKLRYSFTVAIAPYAIEEYEYWEAHDGWNGQHVWEETKQGGRACRRDKRSGKIVWVSPGLIFPILGAMSAFVVEKSPGNWVVERPAIFKPGEMIVRAVTQFRGVKSDPMQMGRSAGAYDALRIYPETLIEVMRAVAE